MLGKCGMMGSSEQALGTRKFANREGIFCCPKAYLFGAKRAVYRSCCNGEMPLLANRVPSHDRRRALRVQKQEMHHA